MTHGGGRVVNQNAKCTFWSIFELNLTTKSLDKSLDKSLVLSRMKIVTLYGAAGVPEGTGQCRQMSHGGGV
jgi:hypothetical protein